MYYYKVFWILHVTMAAASGSFFIIRGIWMLRDSSWLQRKWVRVLPHIIDTLLLISAISLLFILAYNPVTTGWIAAKILALLGYIVAGTIALKRGATLKIRASFLVVSVLLFLYIVAVAVTHSVSVGLF